MIFEFYDQNYPIPENFKEIGQFFSPCPKPVRTLLIPIVFSPLPLWLVHRNIFYYKPKAYVIKDESFVNQFWHGGDVPPFSK